MTNQELRQFGYKAIAEYNALALKLLSKDWFKKYEDRYGIPHGLAFAMEDGSVSFMPGSKTPTDIPGQVLATAMVAAGAKAMGFLKLSSSPQLDDPDTREQVYRDFPDLNHRSEMVRKETMRDARKAYADRESPKRIFAMVASSHECLVFTAEYDEEFSQFINTQVIDEELLYPGEKQWVDHLINITSGIDKYRAMLAEQGLSAEKMGEAKAKIAEGDRVLRDAFNIETEEDFEQKTRSRRGNGSVIQELSCVQMKRDRFMDESNTHLFRQQ